MAKCLLPVLALQKEDGDMWMSMFKDVWTHLIKGLEAVYELQYITSRKEAKQLLATGTVRAAIAIDSAAASAVKSSGFLQQGGCVIFCGPMPGNTRPTDFAACFTKLGLPWAQQDYYRADFYPGAAAGKLGLPQCKYNVKANVLGNVAAADIVYGPTEQSHTQSLVFPSSSVGNASAAAAAFGPASSGMVGYVGDVNGEDGSTNIVLAMLLRAESQGM